MGQQQSDLATQWFGESDGSPLALALGRTEPPIGAPCTACKTVIAANDAGIVGASVKGVGAFKPRPTRFVLHAKCIVGASSAAAPLAPVPRADAEAAVGKQYRDWERDHPDERPPFPASDLEALKRRRADLQAEYDALDALPQSAVHEERMKRSDRLHKIWMTISEIDAEIRAADGCYPRLGGRLDVAIEEGVTARIRTKAIVLALEDVLPGFKTRYQSRFQEMIERDFDPLKHLAEHAPWATEDAHPEWARDIGGPVYGAFDESPPAATTT